jgi:hypothetical protein
MNPSARQNSSLAIAALMLLTCVFLLAGCNVIDEGAADERRSSVSSSDQSYLAAFGDWINVEPYGEVWTPRVVASWEPFSYGQWVYSDQGWLWESYEPYGWLVYHHGNWEFRDDTGWFWIPSNEWSPATVQWTNFDNYVGWAPAPPAGQILPAPYSPEGTRYWNVVRTEDFSHKDIGKYKIVKNATNLSIGAPMTDRRQPEVTTIEKATKTKITSVKLVRQQTPVGSRVYTKVILPESETKKIKPETATVEREVLVKKPVRPVADTPKKNPGKIEPAKRDADQSGKQNPDADGKKSDSTLVPKKVR